MATVVQYGYEYECSVCGASLSSYQALDGHRKDTSDVRRIGYRRCGVAPGYRGSANTEGSSPERVTNDAHAGNAGSLLMASEVGSPILPFSSVFLSQ